MCSNNLSTVTAAALIGCGAMLTPTAVRAQAPSPRDCHAVLVTFTIQEEQTDTHSQLAALRLIDRENYNQIKDYVSQTRAGDFSLPIDVGISIPGLNPEISGSLDFSGTYEQFSESRNRVFEQQSFNQSTDASSTRLVRALPEEAYEAWTSCVTAVTQASSAGGASTLSVTVSAVREMSALLTIGWFPGVGIGGRPLNNVGVQMVGGESEVLSGLNELSHGTTPAVVMRFERGQPVNGSITGTVDGGRFSEDFEIPPFGVCDDTEKRHQRDWVRIGRRYYTTAVNAELSDLSLGDGSAHAIAGANLKTPYFALLNYLNADRRQRAENLWGGFVYRTGQVVAAINGGNPPDWKEAEDELRDLFEALTRGLFREECPE